MDVPVGTHVAYLKKLPLISPTVDSSCCEFGKTHMNTLKCGEKLTTIKTKLSSSTQNLAYV